jgi:hypothetical protein
MRGAIEGAERQLMRTVGRTTFQNEGALEAKMEEEPAFRTVYDFPVAGHLCSDGIVRYVRLVRRHGSPQPQGTCPQCQTAFQYRKPKPSAVRHYPSQGADHF